MNKKSLLLIPLIMLLVMMPMVQGYQKPEFSMPQRALNSYNSGCLDWEIPSGLTCERPIPLNKHEMVHGMATWGDLIYAIGTKGSIFCLSKDGMLIFVTPVPEKPIGIPVVDEKLVYTMTEKGAVMAFDRVNGEKKWSIQIAPEGTTDINRYGNLAIVGSKSGLHCFKLSNGLRKWNIKLPGTPQPVAIFDNRVVVNYLRGITCVSLITGEILWDVKTPKSINKPLFLGVPVIHFDRIMIPLSDGRLVCMGLYDGKQIWEESHGFSRAPPVTDGGKLWIPGGDRIICHSVLNGKIIWDKQIVKNWVLWTQPIKSGDRLYCAGQGSLIVVVSAKDGSILEEMPFLVGTSQELCAGNGYIAAVNNGSKNHIFVFQP